VPPAGIERATRRIANLKPSLGGGGARVATGSESLEDGQRYLGCTEAAGGPAESFSASVTRSRTSNSPSRARSTSARSRKSGRPYICRMRSSRTSGHGEGVKEFAAGSGRSLRCPMTRRRRTQSARVLRPYAPCTPVAGGGGKAIALFRRTVLDPREVARWFDVSYQ